LVKTNLQPRNTPPFSHPVKATRSHRKSNFKWPKQKNKADSKKNLTQMLAMGFTADVAIKALEKSGNDIQKAISISRAWVKEKLAKKRHHERIDLTDLYNPASCMENPGGVFQDINIYEVFRNVVANLWFLWECAITGQPLMVISQSPEVCTRAVLGVMSIIAPLIYAGDFRPYFTTYDPDFKHFQECVENDTVGCVILGVTNPFFLKVYQSWSNVLYLSDIDEDIEEGKANIIDGNSLENRPIELRAQATEHLRRPNVEKSKKSKGLTYNNKINKMVSRYSAQLEPDQTVLSRLYAVKREAKQEINSINTALLRRYFRDMTSCFLRPFYLYFRYDTKTLNRPDFNPYLNLITLRSFSENAFLEEVRQAPKDYFKNLPLKGKRMSLLKLYSRFLKSPHFGPWFHRKQAIAKAKLTKEVNAAITRVTLENLIEGQSIDNGKIMLREIKHRIKLNQDNLKLKKILVYHLKLVERAIPDHIEEGSVMPSSEVPVRKRKQSSVSTTRDRNPVPSIMSLQHQLDFSLQEQYFRKPSI
jgi:hypothetical protein